MIIHYLQRRIVRIPLLYRLYNTNVIEHYENPRNIGSLDKDDNNVGTGLVGAPACGDVMKLNIRVNKDGIIKVAQIKRISKGHLNIYNHLKPNEIIIVSDGCS